MSRLIEKLERISEGRAQPLGFGAAVNRERTLPMLVVTSVPVGNPKLDEIVAKADADALLFTVENWKKDKETLAQITGVRADATWGVSMQAVSREDIEQLVDMKCDFVIFAPDEAPASILGEERIGKVLQIDSSLGDNLAKTIGRLSVDAVLLSRPGSNQSPLTVHELMVYERLAGGAGKHLLATVPPGSQTDDLENWWSLGVRAVVVDLMVDHPEQRLSQVKEAIEKLPTKKKTARRTSAVLPRIADQSTASPPEEDDDDDDF